MHSGLKTHPHGMGKPPLRFALDRSRERGGAPHATPAHAEPEADEEELEASAKRFASSFAFLSAGMPT